ncbi:glyoxylate/hydroxypyruvate reductase A [Aestuariicella hydrocarbonica]|uniref:Glyoxylate/hydroxypyruvate reductase A n=1 Tax=Pseudomaricurvus hydrocarbonicus TaxID=1470433 RepID=A0A9E5T4R6_9GAMM|nr:glyoxylate/hydroxypyruvate reductase A [Aestuariicella hydrocarbonica]NHO68373.1 glyoxylate/hydroxypyruvate reductase A [Aestuariicella hydrocarbonica]
MNNTDRPMIIPFVSRIPPHEQQVWINALAPQLEDATVCPIEQLTPEQQQECRLAIVANPDPHQLAALPNLVWVHSVWAGVERMLAELPQATFHIVRLIDPVLTQTMVEAVLAWTLYLHRDMPAYRLQQTQKHWHQRPYRSASEKQIGLLGLGQLGLASARCLQQQGFAVAGWSRSMKTVPDLISFHGEEGLQQLLSQSDIIINLLPLTPATEQLLNRERFAACNPGAALINFGRGGTINDAALLHALDSDQLSHAVLDVFDAEPLAADHPFWTHPQITVLPHISAPTTPSSASHIVATNINHYVQTGELPPIVDRTKGY